MDKLKEKLGPVYKHAFWVTCGAIVVVSLAMWFLSTQLSLRSKTKTNVEAINAAFSKAEEVNNAGVDAAGEGNEPSLIKFHPNENSATATEALNARLKAKVAQAWDEQYKQQRDLFVWPEKLSVAFKKAVRRKLESPRWQFMVGDEQIIVDVLKEQDAINQIATERGIDPAELVGKGKYVPYELPIEVAVPFPTTPEQEITDVFRRVYRDFIKSHVPTLAEKIGARWTPTAGGGGMGTETSSESYYPSSSSTSSGATSGVVDSKAAAEKLLEKEEIVAWNVQNEGHWQTKLTAYADRAAQDYVPTTLQMLYAQEDLWVLESLLDIIKTTNGGAKHKHEAAIKVIDYLLTGKDAGERPGMITLIGGTDATGESSEYGYDTESSESSYESSGGYGTEDPYGEGAEGGVPVHDPADNRYTDRDYKLIKGATLREVFAQEPTTEDAYLRVAKRIPVRIGVQIDARKLNQLLAACGNSPLVVEVRQVRINRHTAADGAAGAAATGDYGGGSSSYESSSIYGGGGSGYSSEDSSTGTVPKASNDVPVEIYGVVLIYNPVDAKTLEVKPDETPETPPSVETPKADAAAAD